MEDLDIVLITGTIIPIMMKTNFMKLLYIHGTYSPDVEWGSGLENTTGLGYGFGNATGSGFGKGNGSGCGYGDGFGEGARSGAGSGSGSGNGGGYGDGFGIAVY